MRTPPLTKTRDTPHWFRVTVNALLMLGVVAMLNMLGATSESGTSDPAHGALLTQQHGQTVAPSVATDSGDLLAPVSAVHEGGMSTAECCGLVMLCMALIVAITAFVLSRRPSGGGVMWQLQRSLSVTLGRAAAPMYRMTPLQRTAVLRL